jgi:hypothetical protein
MHNFFRRLDLKQGRALRAWPLFAAALLTLWGVTGHSPQDLGGAMAVIQLVLLLGAAWLLAAALIITVRQPPSCRTERKSNLPAFQPASAHHESEAPTPPPRTPVRD